VLNSPHELFLQVFNSLHDFLLLFEKAHKYNQDCADKAQRQAKMEAGQDVTCNL